MQDNGINFQCDKLLLYLHLYLSGKGEVLFISFPFRLSNFFRALVFEIRRVLFIPDFTFYITPMDALRHTTKCSDSCTLIILLMSIIAPVRCSGLAHIHVV